MHFISTFVFVGIVRVRCGVVQLIPDQLIAADRLIFGGELVADQIRQEEVVPRLLHGAFNEMRVSS